MCFFFNCKNVPKIGYCSFKTLIKSINLTKRQLVAKDQLIFICALFRQSTLHNTSVLTIGSSRTIRHVRILGVKIDCSCFLETIDHKILVEK